MLESPFFKGSWGLGYQLVNVYENCVAVLGRNAPTNHRLVLGRVVPLAGFCGAFELKQNNAQW